MTSPNEISPQTTAQPTLEQMRVDILEWQGWKHVGYSSDFKHPIMDDPQGCRTWYSNELPALTLDWLHGCILEGRKRNQFFFLEFQRALWKVVNERDWEPDLDYQFSLSMFEAINATAPQRLLALWRRIKNV